MWLYGDTLLAQGNVVAGTLRETHLHSDGMGSVRQASNTGGSVTDTFEYDAFGNELGRTGSTDIDHRYRGEQVDGNTGFYNLRAWWYDPGIGRFASQDEWRGRQCSPISLNKYAYADVDPVNGSDPSGFQTLSEVSLASNINVTLTTGAQGSYRVVLRRVGREVMCLVVEEITERAIIEAVTGGVYVLVDAGGLYTGKTSDFDRRLAQHAKDITKDIERTLARFHFDGKGNDLRMLEQFFMNFLRNNDHTLTNKVNAIRSDGGSANTRQLRELLGKLDFCK